MNLILRAAVADDQAAITKMVRAAGINPFGLAWRNFVVVEEVAPPDIGNRHLVGVGQLRPRGNGAQELASLAVDPAYRGRGLSVLLVHTLIRRATGPLYLMCSSELIEYYCRFGFVEVANPRAMPRAMARLYRIGRVLVPLVTRLEGEPRAVAVMVLPHSLPIEPSHKRSP